MSTAQLWLFAGPNGAGKTTFTKSPAFSLHIQHFLNADEVTRCLLAEKGFSSYSVSPPEVLQELNLAAAERVFSEVQRLLASGSAVAVETVLSTSKYRQVVEQLRNSGGIFNLIYVGLRSWQLSQQRVAIRVAKGGHPVPEEKLPGRWLRSLEQLPWFVHKADHFYIFDNSDSNPDLAPILVAREGATRGSIRIFNRTANVPVVEALLTSGLFNSITFG